MATAAERPRRRTWPALLLAGLVGPAAAMDMHSGEEPIYSLIRADRLEFEGNGSVQLFKWDVDGWVGGDDNRFWIKSEGDYAASQDIVGTADLQLLYSRRIAPFWDAQVGIRRGFVPEQAFDAVIGVQGLAPYEFEVEAAVFINQFGNVLGRLKLAYELLLTQRLILQPRVEVNVTADDLHRGIRPGVYEFEAGMRLRYEILREFAPYIGFDYVQEQSLLEDQESVRVVAGVRAWY